MHYVYLLKSLIKNWYYIGYTDSIKNRFIKHNQGQVRSTRAYAPFQLVYYEAYSDKTLARKRELKLKNNSQQKEILMERLKSI